MARSSQLKFVEFINLRKRWITHFREEDMFKNVLNFCFCCYCHYTETAHGNESHARRPDSPAAAAATATAGPNNLSLPVVPLTFWLLGLPACFLGLLCSSSQISGSTTATGHAASSAAKAAPPLPLQKREWAVNVLVLQCSSTAFNLDNTYVLFLARDPITGLCRKK